MIKEKEEKDEELDEELDEEEEDEEDTSSKGGKQVDARKGPKLHTKASFKALIEKYRKQNPVKFAAKKAEFERKLAKLK